MDKFIEKLKEHGYTVQHGASSDAGDPILNKCVLQLDCYQIWFYPDGRENPDLAFWCLDEIERLGWWGSLGFGFDGNNPITLWATRNVPKEIRGKTKTEACMNALIAVLEAKDA